MTEHYMPDVDLEKCLVIAISSRALFDLETENKIFEDQGLAAYSQYQREHEQDILSPGTAFPLVKSILLEKFALLF